MGFFDAFKKQANHSEDGVLSDNSQTSATSLNNDNEECLNIIITGTKYNKYISRCEEYAPDWCKEYSFLDSTPIEVYEIHCQDEIYQNILREEFYNFLLEELNNRNISNCIIKKITVCELSCHKIELNVIVAITNNDDSSNVNSFAFKDSANKTIDEALCDIPNGKLVIYSPPEFRDQYFWDDLRETCEIWCSTLGRQVIPLLQDEGLTNITFGSNDKSFAISVGPMFELSVFSYAVLVAALREYLTNFNQNDEAGILQILNIVRSDLLESLDQIDKQTKTILQNRLYEYSQVCQNELTCGYSMLGYSSLSHSTMSVSDLENWSKNHRVKCAQLFCDIICYIKMYNKIPYLTDLEKLKKLSGSYNHNQNFYMKIYNEVYPASLDIFDTVVGALNGGRRTEWKYNGLCQHCGRRFDFKDGKEWCSSCEIEKDYISEEFNDDIFLKETPNQPKQDEDKDDVATSFTKYYKNMLNITKSAEWIENAAFELLPAMFVVCDYAVASAGKDRRTVADSIIAEIRSLYPEFNATYFDNRVNLYGEIIRGAKDLRCEFAFGNKDAWTSNPIMKVAALWGDITINPDCADDYDSAPIMIRGMDVVLAFCAEVLKPVLNEMSALFKEIHDIVTNLQVYYEEGIDDFDQFDNATEEMIGTQQDDKEVVESIVPDYDEMNEDVEDGVSHDVGTVLENLERLSKLKDSGVITEDEFAKLKSEVLKGQ